ncbi:hypothetical protein [Psychrobacillus sp. L3]|uniref:hypothetical protein n=1 Tax=Psychrobacillus sp. L3 TaxID=3236891 RepID=UPI0036F1BEFA
MIKTIKGKVVAGTVAVTLFAGSGVAFGALDAGAKLQNWYNSAFASEKSAVEQDTTTKVDAFNTDLGKIYSDRKKVATDRIKTTELAEISEKETSIKTEAQKHITLVDQKKEEISDLMASQFDKIFQDADKLIRRTGNEALNNAKQELPGFTEGLGNTAIGNLNTELTATTEQAVIDLKAAINEAQGSLSSELQKKSGLTKGEIVAAINAKTIEVRAAIVELRNKLVTKQQELIIKEAKRLEKDAKDQLQTIVNGI